MTPPLARPLLHHSAVGRRSPSTSRRTFHHSTTDSTTMAGISDSEAAEYRKVFDKFDKDGQGSIDAAEMKAALQGMGHDPTDEQVQAMIKDVDKDGSGKIEWPEFLASMAKKPKKEHKEAELSRAFKDIDTDGSGSIDAAELRSLLDKMGISEVVNDEALKKMISDVDASGDGKVQYKEFLKMMRAA